MLRVTLAVRRDRLEEAARLMGAPTWSAAVNKALKEAILRRRTLAPRFFDPGPVERRGPRRAKRRP